MNTLGLETGNKIPILSIYECELYRKRVLLRLDINSPIDPKSKKIVNDNRLKKSLPTIRYLIEQEAAITIIAHQGDTLDYQNLIPLDQHAAYLGSVLNRDVRYIDDLAGPAAQELIRKQKPGDILCLGNLRYYTEEVSTFEDDVPLEADGMLNTYLIRNIAPYFDVYINDAFAAAHRNAPSMVAFQEILPSAAGILFFEEITALNRVMTTPNRPTIFLLGGAKISDAFDMMEQVLKDGSADRILVGGVTAMVMLIASGVDLGSRVMAFLQERSLDVFIAEAKRYLELFPDKILMPMDLACEEEGLRKEYPLEHIPQDRLFPDIGKKTIEYYINILMEAGTIFVNGPAGVFEHALWETGTRELWKALESCPGYVVIGGGDSVNAAARFTDVSKIDYICTAGGAMVRYLSGKRLPLIAAMEKAYKRYKKN